MERRLFVRGAGLAGVLAAGTAPAIVHAQANLRWRLTSSFPKALDTLFGVNDVFANKVKEMSGGKFVITTHAPGELVPAFGVVDAIQAGTVEMCNTAPYYFFGKDPTYALDCAIPFGLNQRQMNAWMYEGNGMKLLREFYAKYNILNFPMGNTGAQMGGWYRKEIKTVADLKGLKMRLGGGLFGETMAKLGVVAQNMPAGEVYQALEKGTLDATEFVGPFDDERLGFNKVAPFYHYPGWWEGGAELEFFINKKAFDALSAENKAIVRAAGAVAARDMTAKYDAQNPAALRRLVAAGTKLRAFDKSIMDAGYKAAMEVFAAHEAKSPEFKKIHQDMRAFQRDQVLWSKFSEWRYDSYIGGAKI